jgi:hypothetical protein
MCCKYFSSFVIYILTFIIFGQVEVLYFYRNKFILIQMLPPGDYVMFRNAFPTTGLQKYLPVFSPNSFSVHFWSTGQFYI